MTSFSSFILGSLKLWNYKNKVRPKMKFHVNSLLVSWLNIGNFRFTSVLIVHYMLYV